MIVINDIHDINEHYYFYFLCSNNVAFLYIYRWNSPVSVAMHAPGTDFVPTINAIKYLRDCLPESNLVRQFATFHIYFSSKHIPKNVSLKIMLIKKFKNFLIN